ncbi:MAG: AraC family transcriptional regulator [Sphingobacterium sp.]|jgi:AraC-like DNA-binding protein/mannose-6-phosphate isomerase-like protein (cupin superfamily)|uniref:AraC family transcriptional regulator n=1 Tax=Sphingobacterium sp. TaxID=341027 RepID=UPI002845F7CA|nr:AraC family transcriptional regulator [Sphingobacterium sp.]MDR3011030.1 AraC family transcriptional regulator [Sphingobacterium sp.]
MQNDMGKCGLTEAEPGRYTDRSEKKSFLWYERNYQHDNYEHYHSHYQLTYVEEGYQYFHIENSIYLVPQNSLIWIPSGIKHRISSDAKTVNLMVLFFSELQVEEFHREVRVFSCPAVLREMLIYAKKWNKLDTIDKEESSFLATIINSLPSFCNENTSLQIPVPTDKRLAKVCNQINVNYVSSIDLIELASLASLSVRQMQRIFKQETGITILKYQQLLRIVKSVELLDSGQFTQTEIATMVGYKSLHAFSSSFKLLMKKRPAVNKHKVNLDE